MIPPGTYDGKFVAVEESDFKVEAKVLLKLRDDIVTIQFELHDLRIAMDDADRAIAKVADKIGELLNDR